MTDPIDLLRRAAVTTAATADLAPDPVAAVRHRVDRDRRRRRSRIGVAAASLIVLTGVAVVAARDGGEGETVMLGPTTVAPTPDEGVPPSPLSRRRQVALAATGDDVVVWGGFDGARTALSDGAAYDRVTGEWRMLAPSPLADQEDSGSEPVAALVDGGVVVARGTAAARWDRATDTWTALGDAPAPVADLTAIGEDRLASIGGRAVLDASTGRWQQLPAPPVELARTAEVWTGTELLAIGSPPDQGPGPAIVVALDPVALTWRAVTPPGDLVTPYGVGAAWDGERVIVTDDDLRAATYDPATDSWTALPDVPARGAEHWVTMASVGGVTVTSMAQTLAVLVDDRWIPFPSPNPDTGGVGPGHGPIPVGDASIGTWVDDAGPSEADLVLLDPATLEATDRRRQVGVASVLLGPDDVLVDARLTRRAPAEADLVAIDVAVAGGRTCTVNSAPMTGPGSTEQRAVREEVAIDDPRSRRGALVWFHDAGGTRWESEVDDLDLLVVDCDDADAARRLVESVSVGRR